MVSIRMRTILPFFTLLSFMVISGCQEDFILDASLPEAEPALVVNSIFRPDTLFSVYVNTSVSPVGIDKPEAFSDARVEIVQDGEVIDVLPYKTSLPYDFLYLNPINDTPAIGAPLDDQRTIAQYESSQFVPIPGELYEVRVSADGFDTVMGADVIPELVPILDIEYTETGVDESAVERAEIKIVFQDPPGEVNYYNLRHHYRQMDTSTGFIISLTEGFELLTDLQDDLFGADPDDLIGNLEPPRITIDGVTFSDVFFDGEQQEIIIEVANDLCSYNENTPIEFECQQIIELSAVTETFYEYHRTLQLQSQASQNPFAEAVRIKSNTSNKMGVVSGQNTSVWVHVRPR